MSGKTAIIVSIFDLHRLTKATMLWSLAGQVAINERLAARSPEADLKELQKISERVRNLGREVSGATHVPKSQGKIIASALFM